MLNYTDGFYIDIILFQAFFTEHPELVDNDFYITGESYAGHYIPAVASRVHKGNKNKEGIHINLKVSLCFFLNKYLFYQLSLCIEFLSL